MSAQTRLDAARKGLMAIVRVARAATQESIVEIAELALAASAESEAAATRRANDADRARTRRGRPADVVPTSPVTSRGSEGGVGGGVSRDRTDLDRLTDPPTVGVQGEGRADVAPTSGRLPRNVVMLERPYWIAAYERAVDATLERDGWDFPDRAFNALQSVIEKHCIGTERQAIDRWVEGRVTAFVRDVQASGEEAKLWSFYGPDGLQRWHNVGCKIERSGPRLVRAPALQDDGGVDWGKQTGDGK